MSSANGGFRATGKGWEYTGPNNSAEDFINSALLAQAKKEGPERLTKELQDTPEITKIKKLTFRHKYKYKEKRTTIDKRDRVKSVKIVYISPKYPKDTYELSIHAKNEGGKTIRTKISVVIGYNGYHSVPPVSFSADIKEYPPQYKTAKAIVDQAIKLAQP